MDEDRKLVIRAQAGELEAFEELVSRHDRRLYSLAMSILHNREDAEDVVQTALIRALENLKKFRGDASFATWIHRITVNAALNSLKKRKKRTGVSLEESGIEIEPDNIPFPDFIAPWRENPSEIAEKHELRELLRETIGALPEKYRVVFVLRDVYGLSIAETTAALELTEANVKVRLLRARLALRESLTRKLGDADKRIVHKHE